MKVTNEAGVLSRSERFFATPSATARSLFFYVTRVGHYYYDERYNFLDSCAVARQESSGAAFTVPCPMMIASHSLCPVQGRLPRIIERNS